MMSRFRKLVSLGPRGSGRTTAIIEAANRIGAAVVALNTPHARRLREMGANKVLVYNSDALDGVTGPFLFDHFVLEHIAGAYEKEVRQLAESLEGCQQASARELSIRLSKVPSGAGDR